MKCQYFRLASKESSNFVTKYFQSKLIVKYCPYTKLISALIIQYVSDLLMFIRWKIILGSHSLHQRFHFVVLIIAVQLFLRISYL